MCSHGGTHFGLNYKKLFRWKIFVRGEELGHLDVDRGGVGYGISICPRGGARANK